MQDKYNLKAINTLFIDDEYLKKVSTLIDNELIEMCWGKNAKKMFTQKDVLQSFLDRIEKRDKAFKIGFMGEFLLHCYFRLNTKYTKLSKFFNSEDRSNKRGFDYMFYNKKTGLWYVEVKSGYSDDYSICETNIAKIKEGYNDCKNKFKLSKNKNLWNVAKNEVAQTIVHNISLRSKIKRILDNDVNSDIDNVVLSTVVFNNSDNKITIDDGLKNLFETYQKDFYNITFLCFRKKTIDKIILMFKEKLDNEK